MTSYESPEVMWTDEELEEVAVCPICGAQERKILHNNLTDRLYSAPGTWTLYQCSNCATAYQDPRIKPEFIGKAYENYYTHKVGAETNSFKHNLKKALRNGYLNAKYGYRLKPSVICSHWVMPFFPLWQIDAAHYVRCLPCKVGGKILDVGCGNGDFLKLMRSCGWDVYGLEIDPKAAEVARKDDIVVEQGVLDGNAYSDQMFDAVTLSHVIEHVHDPIATLQQCFRVLKPGGLLFVSTPNISSYSYQRHKEHWRGLEPPRHLIIFNLESLASACLQAGFQLREKYGYPQAFFFYWQSRAIEAGRDISIWEDVPQEKLAELKRIDLHAAKNQQQADIIFVAAQRPIE